LPICRFADLAIWRFEDEIKKCFLKIGEIKKRWKYSSEFTMQTEIIWKLLLCRGGAEDDYYTYENFKR